MARKRSTAQLRDAALELAAAATQATPPPVEDEEGTDPELTDSVLEGLQRLYSGEDTRVTWYVYDDSLEHSGAYIEKIPTEKLSEEYFAQRYGPGEWRVAGRDVSGHYIRGASAKIKISNVLAEPRRRGGGNGAAASESTDALGLLREMRAQEESRARQRADDNRHWAQALAAPVATIAAAFVSRPRTDTAALITALATALRQPQSNMAELTTALVQLKQLEGDKTNTVDTVLKLLDRVQDLPAAGGEGGGGWLGLVRETLREVAPAVRESLGRLTPAAPGAAPGIPGLPPGSAAGPPFGPGVAPAIAHPAPVQPATPPPAAQPGPTQSPAPGEDDMWRLVEPWLRRRAEDLLEEAQANLDVSLAAEMLLEKARKRFGLLVPLEQVAGYLQAPNWFEALVQFHPPLAPYRAWLDDVRQELLKMLAEELAGAGEASTQDTD